MIDAREEIVARMAGCADQGQALALPGVMEQGTPDESGCSSDQDTHLQDPPPAIDTKSFAEARVMADRELFSHEVGSGRGRDLKSPEDVEGSIDVAWPKGTGSENITREFTKSIRPPSES